jgi:hypothetical protein
MNIKAAYSTQGTVDESVNEIAQNFELFDAELVLYFASTHYAPVEVSKKMQDAFPMAQVFGCSTAGEIACGKMLENSLVAMAFTGQAVSDAKIAVIEDLGNEESVRTAFDAFSTYFKEPVAQMDPEKYVGIILVDGLCAAEEGLMETIGDLTNVTFIGGSAGDDLKFSATYVYANGKPYGKSAVLALLKPGVPFSFIKTQSFRDLGKSLEVTKADDETREVIEFNNKPAAVAYAEALGTTVEDAPKHFMHNPVGLFIEDEPYVRSPQQIKGSSMVFYCGIMEGMELSILEGTDIIGDTRAAIAQAQAELGGISGIVNFNCILRTLELRQEKLTDAYGELFAQVPTVGFSTYGEQYIGHINQTATMLVFK